MLTDRWRRRALRDWRRCLGTLVVLGVAAPAVISATAGSADAVQAAFGHVATITLPGPPLKTYAQAVAVDARTNRIYVADFLGNDVVVINGATDKIVASIKGVKHPEAITVDPATDTVYALSGGVLFSAGSVVAISGSTGKIIATTRVGVDPEAIAVDPATDTVYAANDGSAVRGSVSVVSGVTHKLTATIKIGEGPQDIATDPATDTIYVTNLGDSEPNSGSVSVIDGATGTVTGKIAVRTPVAVATNPDTDTVYISAFGHQGLLVADGATDKITATIPRRPPIMSIAVDRGTDDVYAAWPWVGKVDGRTNAWIGAVPFPHGVHPEQVAVDAVTDRVYTANGPSSTVSVLSG